MKDFRFTSFFPILSSLTCSYFDATTGLIDEDVTDITFEPDSLGLLPNPILVTIDKWPVGIKNNHQESDKITNYPEDP